ncbi:MAG: alpha-amylase/alpha-mannosidase [Planctomycetes bacterium]|nr:alpha-amylase/alpha-mannosidase [Planctomycetota bacterium]
MQPVALAFLWHQHQPYYPDDVSGQTLMPWVRLHGTKDYYGMALHLKEVPEFHCTINLVPSLLLQLQKYTNEGGSDRHLDVSRKPADGLSESDAHYLMDNFFMANVDSMIRPFSRYHELYSKRGFGIDSVESALPRYSERDLRDLQVWSNLTWIHELVFEQDAELREFREQGQHWSEDEKNWLLDKQLEILKKIIPLHRELADSGQVELTTTPFYHPILPLLIDKRSAHQAMPGCDLPRHLDSYSEDAKTHLNRAVAYHKELFGAAPKGMWPSEGSVSQEVIGAIAETGIEWIATDEEILAESTNGWISRDGHGHLRHPEMLYRPWRAENGEQSLQMVFRDHALSDLIGFHYQRSEPHHAADDLINRVLSIGRAVEPNNGGRPALVPIILDGENCWEYYPDGGVGFLRNLYRSCAENPSIRPVRIRDFLQEHPPTDHIGHLYSGSWISHNFAIWIGHHEDNTAWDLLHQTREFLRQTESEGQTSKDVLEKAWEELFIAEGSDWFWWFGDDHSSALDALFDELFRRHLKNVYTLLNASCPTALNQPISQAVHRAIHTQPTGFLPVKVDGRHTYFEWICAGHYVSGNERGTMTMVSDRLLREIYFGFDAERLLLRVDTAGEAIDDLSRIDEIRVRFDEPSATEIRLTGLRKRTVQGKLYRKDRAVSKAEVLVACDSILELSVRFADLKLKPDDSIRMQLETFSNHQSIDRSPQEGYLELTVPSPDFELMMWQA